MVDENLEFSADEVMSKFLTKLLRKVSSNLIVLLMYVEHSRNVGNHVPPVFMMLLEYGPYTISRQIAFGHRFFGMIRTLQDWGRY